MIFMPPMMEVDQTVVHRRQMPASEAQRWTALDIADLLETETDEDVRQSSEPADRQQTALDEEEDRASVKRSPASTGEDTSSILPVGGEPRYSTAPLLDPEAVLILRAKYLGAVLTSLENMQPYARTPHVARYAGEMLDASTVYADRVPDDPVVEVVLAVYPALADENHWADWSSEQFRDLHRILQGLARRTAVTPEMVEKAITKIEQQVALDTLPFEVDPREIS